MGEPVRIELTSDEALVLFAFLQRFEEQATLTVQDQAEQRALWNLHCLLEKHQLVESLHLDYQTALSAARDRLRDPPD